LDVVGHTRSARAYVAASLCRGRATSSPTDSAASSTARAEVGGGRLRRRVRRTALYGQSAAVTTISARLAPPRAPPSAGARLAVPCPRSKGPCRRWCRRRRRRFLRRRRSRACSRLRPSTRTAEHRGRPERRDNAGAVDLEQPAPLAVAHLHPGARRWLHLHFRHRLRLRLRHRGRARLHGLPHLLRLRQGFRLLGDGERLRYPAAAAEQSAGREQRRERGD